MKTAKINWVSKGENSTNPQISFISPINIDNGFTNVPQGEMESTMELFHDRKNNDSGCIEWVVDDGEFVENIGLFFEGTNNLRLVDYDGVFELPNEAIKMLRGLGYSVPKDFENN
jgi:hypothetical protein